MLNHELVLKASVQNDTPYLCSHYIGQCKSYGYKSVGKSNSMMYLKEREKSMIIIFTRCEIREENVRPSIHTHFYINKINLY